jgi:deazaflavin-dependent oxidoreductase (nitroreductase family)
MKKDDFGTAEEKAVGNTKSAVISEVVVEQSNGELTEDHSDSEPPSSEMGSVILSRPLSNDRNNQSISETSDFNERNIKEFRANHGRVGGGFEGAPLVLLHTTGARTGEPRVNPTMYLPDGERYLVFASKAGADTNPDWYHNLKAHPEIQIEIGDQTLAVHAEEVFGPERDTLFERQATLFPGFAGYQRKTDRRIPVMALSKSKK